MPSGSADSLQELPEVARAVLTESRSAVLSTLDGDGAPHSVPVVCVVVDGNLVIPIDGKPKGGSALTRVSNIARDERVTVLFDRWDEDWRKLAWVMVRGTASTASAGTIGSVLRDHYPQYDRLSVETGAEAIVVRPLRISWWSWL